MRDDGLAFSDRWVFRFSSVSWGSSLILIPGLITFSLQID